MVSSCIDIYLKGNLPVGDGAGGVGAAAGVFDGIDIDWEYPGGGGQPLQHGQPRRQAQLHPSACGVPSPIERAVLADRAPVIPDDRRRRRHRQDRQHRACSVLQSLDWINLMTYDYHGGFEPQGPTNFQSNLHMDPNNPATGVTKTYATENAVNKLLAAGVPAQKLVIGIPLYGRGWTGVPNGGVNGLYHTGDRSGARHLRGRHRGRQGSVRRVTRRSSTTPSRSNCGPTTARSSGASTIRRHRDQSRVRQQVWASAACSPGPWTAMTVPPRS